jgi:1-deoxy-D-xylulose-5-phosphate reductoisomerase
VGESGGTAPAVYNAANEVCVEAFRAGDLAFVDIVDTVRRVLHSRPVGSESDLTVDDVLAADAWARASAAEHVKDHPR